jgi:parallel beta-helix repeat protein
MRSFTILIAVALFPTYARAQSTVPFTPGMVVTGSTRIEPGTYDVPGPESLEDALIVVRGDGVTLDLSGVTLRGLPVEADPDLATGVAIRVDGGTDIAIRGGVIRGYRFGVLARDTRGLRVLDVDLSYGWKPRLFSLLAHESLVDWLSYHNNEEREWMRFGAALYLDGVKGGEVRGVRAVQGMNGLLMSYSDSIRVQDNDFSYNSGLGVGLYHASGNVIVRNLLDYDVRGYGEGFYERGQDSAGLLVYAQSSGNVIAYNSATHSGDGFFLWAGQRTMDTGEGGANDNLLFHNDFSYAPTNGIEVTFSRNRIVGNIVRGNRYGVWGGYSWETVIRGNCFADNRFGVAIEHGQDNVILGNQFDGDSLAISLWARASEPADWGYARARDTRSRDHLIRNNLFAGNAQIWRLERTEGHEIGSNSVRADRPADRCDPRVLLGTAFDSLAPELPGVPRQIPAAPRAELPRSAIVVDAWGPWDGRSPKLWPVDTVTTEVVLRVLGPPGEWRVVGRRGLVAVSGGGGGAGGEGGVGRPHGGDGARRARSRLRRRLGARPRVHGRADGFAEGDRAGRRRAGPIPVRAIRAGARLGRALLRLGRRGCGAHGGRLRGHAHSRSPRAPHRLRVVHAADRRPPPRALGRRGDHDRHPPPGRLLPAHDQRRRRSRLARRSTRDRRVGAARLRGRLRADHAGDARHSCAVFPTRRMVRVADRDRAGRRAFQRLGGSALTDD